MYNQTRIQILALSCNSKWLRLLQFWPDKQKMSPPCDICRSAYFYWVFEYVNNVTFAQKTTGLSSTAIVMNLKTLVYLQVDQMDTVMRWFEAPIKPRKFHFVSNDTRKLSRSAHSALQFETNGHCHEIHRLLLNYTPLVPHSPMMRRISLRRAQWPAIQIAETMSVTAVALMR